MVTTADYVTNNNYTETWAQANKSPSKFFLLTDEESK